MDPQKQSDDRSLSVPQRQTVHSARPADRDAAAQLMREQIDRVIGHFGELVVNKISGVVIASDSGGFIQGYVERKALKRKA